MPTLTAPARTVDRTAKVLDARPDRIDLRDREYQPRLVSIPDRYPDAGQVSRHLERYRETGLILDQRGQGACTGFGLAAVINFIVWRRGLDRSEPVPAKVERVSPHMLYHLAQLYDEWEGEDYAGSSCRGAMKGWHHHGVCGEALWRSAGRPDQRWRDDAIGRPLGAYYRIDRTSLADMQNAIHEVGAIYVSATVHRGWRIGASPDALPTLERVGEGLGAHACALVGYDRDGFILQNSWGEGWGHHGFARLAYDDWLANGMDAWVAMIGVPTGVQRAPRANTSVSLLEPIESRTTWSWPWAREKPYQYRNPALKPLDESGGYEHTVVLGNNGQPIQRLVDVADADAAVDEVCFALPAAWFAASGVKRPRLAIYAHGGLNAEKGGVTRARIMAPYFLANGIYPIFLVWRTGFGESIGGIVADALARYLGRPVEGLLDDIGRRLKDAKDRTIEAACEQLAVKSIWEQMKQNASAAALPRGGLTRVVQQLARLAKAVPRLELHFAGHSAGSIIGGHLFDCARRKLTFATTTLFAPACTAAFALDHFAPAIEARTVAARGFHVDLMSDEREQADGVGPYGKSLLYLVSRALEDLHKMPLMGMHALWDAAAEPTADVWNERERPNVDRFRAFAKARRLGLQVWTKRHDPAPDGVEKIPLAHGSFDNDVRAIGAMFERMTGGPLTTTIENLRGF